MKNLYLLVFVILTLNCSKVMAQASVLRKDLLTAQLQKQVVSRVEIKEVTIPAGGKASYHLHRCPVVGYVVSGSVLFQIEGQSQQILEAGSAFYEPKDQPILKFDNASDSIPLVFTAYYLLEDNEDIITILPTN